MDQNQTVDNDLQKAIDDITNTTNTDPVFSDPVAAPSSVPENDSGALGEPIGPFPEPKIEATPPFFEQTTPLESTDMPDLSSPELTPPQDLTTTPPTTESTSGPTPESTTEPALESSPEPAQTPNTEADNQNLDVSQIKDAALRDLIPLLDKLNMDASQRFNLYRTILEDLHDNTVLEPAYKTAKEITDETERANALLYLVEAINKL